MLYGAAHMQLTLHGHTIALDMGLHIEQQGPAGSTAAGTCCAIAAVQVDAVTCNKKLSACSML